MQNPGKTVMRNTLPNLISTLRIVGTICLLFIKPFSPVFFIIYTICGVSDVLDGWLARKMAATSELGARIDSVADILFYAVMLFKFFPILWERLPVIIWGAVGAIILLRLTAYGVAAGKYKRFASLHTYMNKLTGAAVFAIPFMIKLPFGRAFCWTVCGIAALASLEELLLHICSGEYRENVKTIIQINSVEN